MFVIKFNYFLAILMYWYVPWNHAIWHIAGFCIAQLFLISVYNPKNQVFCSWRSNLFSVLRANESKRVVESYLDSMKSRIVECLEETKRPHKAHCRTTKMWISDSSNTKKTRLWTTHNTSFNSYVIWSVVRFCIFIYSYQHTYYESKTFGGGGWYS